MFRRGHADGVHWADSMAVIEQYGDDGDILSGDIVTEEGDWRIIEWDDPLLLDIFVGCAWDIQTREDVERMLSRNTWVPEEIAMRTDEISAALEPYGVTHVHVPHEGTDWELGNAYVAL